MFEDCDDIDNEITNEQVGLMLVIYKIAVKFIFDFGVDFKFEVDNRVFFAVNGSVDLPIV